MKKNLLLFGSTLLLLAFKPNPSGFPDLRPDGNPANSYATQGGNMVSCYTKALLEASPISGSSAFKVGFYLSTDTAITTSDLLIGTYSVTYIGTSAPVTCSVTNVDLTTKSVPTGTYYIGVYVDYLNEINENGMTPELANNNWSFKDANKVYKVIHYPGLDVGIAENKISNDVEKQVSANGDLTLKSKTGSDLRVEVYSIDGRLLQKEKGNEVFLERKENEVVILKITTEKGSYSEKVIL